MSTDTGDVRGASPAHQRAVPGEAPLRGDLPSAPASARAPATVAGDAADATAGSCARGGRLERGERVEVRGGAERRGVRRHGGREEEAREGRRVDRSRETCHRELFKRGDETPRRGVKTGANRARIARAWTPTARVCARARCARACAPRENDATDEPTVHLSSKFRAREFARLAARTAARGRTEGTSPCMSVCCSKEISSPSLLKPAPIKLTIEVARQDA